MSTFLQIYGSEPNRLRRQNSLAVEVERGVECVSVEIELMNSVVDGRSESNVYVISPVVCDR
ncbi:MAG: hypothetical protein AAF517_22375 [Planctomycetota bacterium]